MDSFFPSTNPTNFRTHEVARQLKMASEDLAVRLRDEKVRLNRMGMSLPRRTIENLEELHKEFEKLILRIQENQMELLQLRNIAKTTELINSSLTLNEVLEDVMNRVVNLSGAERGYVMLLNEQTGELEIAVARKLTTRMMDVDGELSYSKTILSRVLEKNEPVITSNAQEDTRFNETDSIIGYQMRSIICVPLSFRDKVIGVVYCDNRMQDGTFGKRELRMLSAFANQAAIAIENAKFFEQISQSLQEITDIKTLLDNILASIASGVLTTDANETVTIYNLAAEGIFGRPAIQTMGHTLDAAIPALYYKIRTQMRQLGLENAQLEVDIDFDARGTRNLNLQLAPLKNVHNQIEGLALVADDLTEVKLRDATLAAVRRYLPPVMVDNIQTLDRLALGGERRNITIMYVDVRSFDTFAENLSPRALMETLNTYLTIASEGVHHHAGMIDKYMGSEVMSLFNTQLNPLEDHAWQSVQAALRIAADLTTLATFMQRGVADRPYFRIGIHSGVATLGNVGSAARREFTAIGDSVNLAKRLQENAKIGEILVSESTMLACQGHLDSADWIEYREYSNMQVKGKTQVVKVYQIMGRK